MWKRSTKLTSLCSTNCLPTSRRNILTWWCQEYRPRMSPWWCNSRTKLKNPSLHRERTLCSKTKGVLARAEAQVPAREKAPVNQKDDLRRASWDYWSSKRWVKRTIEMMDWAWVTTKALLWSLMEKASWTNLFLDKRVMTTTSMVLKMIMISRDKKGNYSMKIKLSRRPLS